MTWLAQASLVNEPFSDPGLFIDFRFGRRALLFDLGDLTTVPPRRLWRVSHAFVSHAHMDHFAGFDRLLRVCLNRTTPLHVVGPHGFLDRVEHKLKAYTLNLLGGHSPDFVITAAEFKGDDFMRACEFRARESFMRRETDPVRLPPGVLLDEEEFCVNGTELDHGTPCLAFTFEEKLRVNVWSEGLKRLRLPVGAWLNDAKRLVRRGAPDDSPIAVSPDRSIPLGVLREHVLRTARGLKIAYVVDAAYHDRNIGKIIGLARHADQLFIEAAFLDVDADVAAQRRHMTARQAGEIARLTGASRVVPFHFSARYRDLEDTIRSEVEQAFHNVPGWVPGRPA
jgi:ribonuclease Z